ncbi:hypothetical protein [Evansella cellulosilytica]|uniref:Uncharacterized protein n=1 Tax=Evansella cellulosilytica (strain ATCC 21833 / DSM 2522 / FERM P-1141 / JCM 9156 / N-4) TaxID=649639 RepID=E6TS09_EVAC2|nr:hypothetical protein [Evansella cellulosilytica]ADU30663.1 hypothetical protein Bcell_2405 [Evansella cellulosilytica DSM 2522]
MKKWKLVLITSISTTIILFGLSVLSPYNFLEKITEDNIVNDEGISELFDGKEIQSITY